LLGPTFEWDEEKNRLNQAKHGVSFEAAQDAFLDPMRIIRVDLEHSGDEPRFFCLGLAGSGGVLTVRFTYRAGRVRNFGAGYWRRGRRIYGQENGGVH
jgi:uncharacterized DUF497 family protein